ncbi:tRNA delta(2)-isopentenylpyrophosphate transferase (plasmid) [Legionella adelaidensis]|uniref:tRNA dimethylallyltransferase n=1 Tax=Legionella adelaidensis TaxID=45056 RepID=A0A0W0R0E2_9GAMM|nr:tRNA (adenosine(37)-N6)-dimethylallyltransferase MiaA [Legionella adelaidensis]KTC64517.1 tRNA delta(2)-isopentenylpyrophosphate transferase [Legionella adelaidensis]VEH85885.1 tRNA delta(2)-isopentenylpyrophosphate transferase [Legionella adelaidensis]
MSNQIVCLMGPTASGKTDLACELVRRFPFEIVSVDSALIYKEMNIGTAKPNSELLEKAPHHLIDFLNPDQSYSAANFCEDAIAVCKKILSSNKIPLLVGGTMMYFNALQQGLSNLPEANEEIRNALLKEAQQHGWEFLWNQLKQVDPMSANKIHPNDTQRIQRALEVYKITGQPLSHLLGKETKLPYRYINILLIPEDRAWLHKRIALRLDEMLAQGFIKEVEDLHKKWQLNSHYPSMRTVGYRQAISYLEGEGDFAEFREKAIVATRQLAKRQITWLRHWNEGTVLHPENKNVLHELVEIAQQIVDNSSQ